MAEEKTAYVMGRSPSETQRLQAQEKVFGRGTEQLLRLAGIRPGMRILDVGCGAGDVTLTAARIAGTSGSVLGVDADADILTVARQRVADAGIRNASFTQGTIPDLPLSSEFDAVIGRFILIHLDDPAAVLRTVSRLVVPGGLVTFQDLNITRMRSVPPLPLVAQCTQWICEGLCAGGRDPDTGEQLFAIFREAGLPVPEMMVAVPAVPAVPTVSGQAVCEVVAATVSSLLPLIERAGVATREEIDPGTLARRLWEEAKASDALLVAPELAGAWARIPSDGASSPAY
jgi:2-polyprenyl-3-methyl-5-hydroxy-6-metoxy-1,4-benzoquinol methylase